MCVCARIRVVHVHAHVSVHVCKSVLVHVCASVNMCESVFVQVDMGRGQGDVKKIFKNCIYQINVHFFFLVILYELCGNIQNYFGFNNSYS